MNLTIYSDGGSLNNPGHAACSYLIYNNGILLEKKAFDLGINSNNVAEYMGLIRALERVRELGKKKEIKSITCISDSLLMVEQMNGNYKVKHPSMKILAQKAKNIILEIGVIPTFKHVLREKNREADALVKTILEY